MRFIFLFLLCTIPIYLLAQQDQDNTKSHEVSLDLAQLYRYGNFHFGFEKHLLSGNSLGLSFSTGRNYPNMGFGHESIAGHRRSGFFSFQAAYHFYLFKQKKMTGLSVFPMVNYSHNEALRNDFEFLTSRDTIQFISDHTIGLGAGILYKFPITRDFSVGLRMEALKHINIEDTNLGFITSFGVVIGYKF